MLAPNWQKRGQTKINIMYLGRYFDAHCSLNFFMMEICALKYNIIKLRYRIYELDGTPPKNGTKPNR